MASLRFSSQIGGKNASWDEFGRNRKVGFGGRVGLRVFGWGAQEEPDLSVNVNGLKMPNPFVIGSGPPGTNYTVMKRAFDEGWGAVIAKT
ncbi:Dihydropyrimidine dehydrogenase [NADP(+)], partial [Sarracenia purpurea var. burkii]